MNQKPSTKWFYLNLMIIILLILLGSFFSITSYRNTQHLALELGIKQLNKINDNLITSLQLKLELYNKQFQSYGESLERMEIIPDKLVQTEKFYQFFIKNPENNKELYLLNADGQLLDGKIIEGSEIQTIPVFPEHYQQDPFFSEALKGTMQENGGAYFENHSSYLNFYYPIMQEGQLVRLLVVVIDLNHFFDSLLYQEGTDNLFGYTMIKNEEMQVLVHPSQEQIGLRIVADRQKRFPNLDFTDLVALEKQQLSQQAGTASYHSYWWTTNDPTRVLKLTAFEWMTVGPTRWVVATNTDLEKEMNLQLQETLLAGGVLTILLALTLMMFFYFKTYIRRRQIFEENQRLLAFHKVIQEKHELEKNLMQKSKLETVGLLTSSIVHDMNNFLTPIVGNVEYLLEENKDNNLLTGDLKEIQQAAEQGKKLSSNILRFSKVTAEEQSNLDVSQVVKETAESFHLLLPKSKKLHVEIDRTGNASFEKGDLEVILYNLITNALQAGPNQRPIHLKVQMLAKCDLEGFSTPLPDVQHFALISITDFGPGIPKEIQTQIFNPFFTTKTASGGTGLGLFIVSSMTKKNHWLLKLESDSGGTTFSLAIPLDE